MLKHRVRIGGLMRCCYPATIDLRIAEDRPPKDGERLQCKICKKWMVYQVRRHPQTKEDIGAWEWARDDG